MQQLSYEKHFENKDHWGYQFSMEQPSPWTQGNIFFSIMTDFELFFLPFKDKFNIYVQTMWRGRKAIMYCVEEMMP